MFKHRIGSGQGQVVGHLAQNATDPCIVSGQGGLVHASLLDVSCRVFSSWIRGFGFGSGFGSKITARTRPMDYYESKTMAHAHPLHWSGRVRFERIRLGWSSRAVHDQIYS
jgi:hypothetical protein